MKKAYAVGDKVLWAGSEYDVVDVGPVTLHHDWDGRYSGHFTLSDEATEGEVLGVGESDQSKA